MLGRASGCVVVAATLLAGCGATTHSSSHTTAHAMEASANPRSPVAPNGRPLGHLSTPGTPKGEQTVPLAVVATPGTEKRATIAVVPVFINGHGPFAFALDTGASRSLMSAQLAKQLHLPTRGSAGKLYGIVGGASAENVLVSSWRAGNVSLPTEVVAVIDSPSATAQPPGAGKQAQGPVGLLGSDVLSRYGKIAVDYDKSLLILDPPVR